MFNTYYSLKEANAELPRVREDLVQLQLLQREYRSVYYHLQAVKKGKLEEEINNKKDLFLMEATIDFIEIQADSLITQLEKDSIFVKSISAGLIDFPAKLKGKDVLFCWKQGEEYIAHYHEVFDSYKKRKKIYTANDN
ncbi:DUF2203 domain-containing protein [Bacillus piscicola]|uniref:DUF2203 domain-containing protein n=1 Tax=Bacillus piscicola TaxID=1632684 RepID=UPI001F0936BD|nr:DUF2203 domain-containing protein [Bacillus piscicola]